MRHHAIREIPGAVPRWVRAAAMVAIGAVMLAACSGGNAANPFGVPAGQEEEADTSFELPADLSKYLK